MFLEYLKVQPYSDRRLLKVLTWNFSNQMTQKANLCTINIKKIDNKLSNWVEILRSKNLRSKSIFVDLNGYTVSRPKWPTPKHLSTLKFLTLIPFPVKFDLTIICPTDITFLSQLYTRNNSSTKKYTFPVTWIQFHRHFMNAIAPISLCK